MILLNFNLFHRKIIIILHWGEFWWDWLKWNDSLSVPAAAMTGWLCPHVDFLNPFFFALICADLFICITANKKKTAALAAVLSNILS